MQAARNTTARRPVWTRERALRTVLRRRRILGNCILVQFLGLTPLLLITMAWESLYAGMFALCLLNAVVIACLPPSPRLQSVFLRCVCMHCRYPRRGLRGDRCPECGAPHPAGPARYDRARLNRRRRGKR